MTPDKLILSHLSLFKWALSPMTSLFLNKYSSVYCAYIYYTICWLLHIKSLFIYFSLYILKCTSTPFFFANCFPQKKHLISCEGISASSASFLILSPHPLLPRLFLSVAHLLAVQLTKKTTKWHLLLWRRHLANWHPLTDDESWCHLRFGTQNCV